MIKTLFVAICEHLKKEVPAIKFMDLWNDNVANLAGGAVWPTPAVFVEFDIVEWRQEGRHARMGNVPVRLHIIQREVKYNGFEDSRMDEALARFDLIRDINMAMLSLNGENFTTFMLTHTATNHNHAELIEDTNQYVTRAQDTTTLPQKVNTVNGLKAAIIKP